MHVSINVDVWLDPMLCRNMSASVESETHLSGVRDRCVMTCNLDGGGCGSFHSDLGSPLCQTVKTSAILVLV